MFGFHIYTNSSKDKKAKLKVGYAAYNTFNEAKNAAKALSNIPKGMHLVERCYPNTGYKLMQYGGLIPGEIKEI